SIIHHHRMSALAYALVGYLETHDRGRSFRAFSCALRSCAFRVCTERERSGALSGTFGVFDCFIATATGVQRQHRVIAGGDAMMRTMVRRRNVRHLLGSALLLCTAVAARAQSDGVQIVGLPVFSADGMKVGQVIDVTLSADRQIEQIRLVTGSPLGL